MECESDATITPQHITELIRKVNYLLLVVGNLSDSVRDLQTSHRVYGIEHEPLVHDCAKHPSDIPIALDTSVSGPYVRDVNILKYPGDNRGFYAAYFNHVKDKTPGFYRYQKAICEWVYMDPQPRYWRYLISADGTEYL